MRYIVNLLFVIFFIINCKCDNKENINTKISPNKSISSQQELKTRKERFSEFKKEVSILLKKTKSLTGIKDYLRDSFYYYNYFIKNPANSDEPYSKSYENNDSNLIEINNRINIQILIETLDKGEYDIGENSAYINSPLIQKDRKKYPMIDFKYVINLSKWKISAIRHEMYH